MGFRDQLPLAESVELVDLGGNAISQLVDTSLRNFTITAENPYSTVVVQVDASDGRTYGVGVVNQSRSSLGCTMQTIQGSSAAGGTLATFYFSLPCQLGDVIQVNVRATGGSSTRTFRVFGLSAPHNPRPLRPDGRLYVQGNLSKFLAVTTLSNGNLIAAPGAAISILLASLTLYTGIGTVVVYSQLSGTINGAALDLEAGGGLAAGVGIEIPNMVQPQGLLLDPNTALTYNIGAAAGTVGAQLFATYDLVF